MPKAPSGPRRIDSSGTYYAVVTFNGKKHYKSLGTKYKAEAQRLWPEAYSALCASVRPPTWPRGVLVPITEYDPVTGAARQVSEWSDNLTSPAYLTDVQGSNGWDEAIAVAEKRFKRRKGRVPSSTWHRQIREGRQFISKDPLDLTPADVRKAIAAMEQHGWSDTTIAQRCQALSGVCEALIRQGIAADTYQNPFRRVDVTAARGKSHYKAQPQDYQWISAIGALKQGRVQGFKQEEYPLQGLKQGDRHHLNTLLIITFTGCRVSEAINSDVRDGWLVIHTAKNAASVRDVPLPDVFGPPLKQGAESFGQCLKQGSTAFGGAPMQRSGSVDSFRAWFNKHKSNPDLTPHSYRHGWKTAARSAGADTKVTERLLGHAVGAMEATYGEFSREVMLREARKVWSQLLQWM